MGQQEAHDNQGDFELWLAQARAGSSKGLGRVFAACQEDLVRSARHQVPRNLSAKADPSDLVQEALLEGQRDFGQFRGTSQARLLGWLRRILDRNAQNLRRRYRAGGKRQASGEVSLDNSHLPGPVKDQLMAQMPCPEGAAVRHERARAVRRAIKDLPARYRRILYLRFWRRLRFGNIGRLLHCSPEAARKLCGRALSAARMGLRAQR